jgi:hypothetical protein
MPDEPIARFGVHVLAVSKVEQLAFEHDLRLRIRTARADRTAEDDLDGHSLTVVRRA